MWSRIQGFLSRQIEEIRSSRAVSLYGAMLCFVHLVSAWFFLEIRQIASSGKGGICWPFLEGCRGFHLSEEGTVLLILAAYVAAAIAGTALFLLRRRPAVAYTLLTFLFFWKFLIVFQDYRFMGNYHYMPAILNAAYLLLPGKILGGAVFLTLFYLTAGLLKIHHQWLGGLVLWRPTFLPIWLFSLACTYVVFLEMAIVFGLWARRAWIRWSSWAQFLVFHLVSYHWVGYFYPAVMLSLLPLFPLAWRTGALSAGSLRKNRFPLGIAVFLYALAQAPSWLVPGDSAVHGQGRLFALNMYDARTACWNISLARYRDRIVDTGSSFQHWAPRIHCDPVIYIDEARRQCGILRADEGFVGLDLELFSRRWTDFGFERLVAVKDFCTRDSMKTLSYPWLGTESWVRE